MVRGRLEEVEKEAVESERDNPPFRLSAALDELVRSDLEEEVDEKD